MYEEFLILSYVFIGINFEWVLFFVFERYVYAKGSQHYAILWGINLLHVTGIEIEDEWGIWGVLVEGVLIYVLFLYGNGYFDEIDLTLATPLLFLNLYLGKEGIKILMFGGISYAVRKYVSPS